MHDIIEEITINNKWRDTEFSKYKINPSKVEEKLWCRMCIPMIYAHWEGFVVSALKILLKYLNSLELSYQQVTTNLTVISLGDSYKSLSGKQSFEQKIDFTDKFYELLQKTVKFKLKIETKSNLNKKVFLELCQIFDFDTQKFNNSTHDINRLVQIRNSIAHGENSFVLEQSDIIKHINAVNTIIDILLQEIELFLVNKRYLSSNE